MDWNEAELVLKATYELLDAGQDVTQDEVCAALGRPPQDERTVRALALLYEGGHRARDAFAALGRDVAVGVLTAYAGKVSSASD